VVDVGAHRLVDDDGGKVPEPPHRRGRVPLGDVGEDVLVQSIRLRLRCRDEDDVGALRRLHDERALEAERRVGEDTIGLLDTLALAIAGGGDSEVPLQRSARETGVSEHSGEHRQRDAAHGHTY
jgi:hypothetical protein